MSENPPSDRGMGHGPDFEHPLSVWQGLEELRASGFPCSRDRYERWRKARILGEPYTISGRGNERFLTEHDRKRLMQIADLHRRFSKDKLAMSAIAFWLAAGGDSDMPTNLIMEHIAASTTRFVDRLFTVFSDRLAGRWMLDDPDRATVERLSNVLGKVLSRMALLGGTIAGRVFFQLTLDVVLTSLLRPTRYAAVAQKIRQTLIFVGASPQQADSWAPHVWEGLIEFGTFFLKGERNAFVRAARMSADLPAAAAGRIARHATMMYELLCEVMPEVRAPGFAETMAPMIAGLLLHLQDRAATADIHAALDRDDIGGLREQLRAARFAIDVLTRRLRAVSNIQNDPWSFGA
jgi:hypothetical protein